MDRGPTPLYLSHAKYYCVPLLQLPWLSIELFPVTSLGSRPLISLKGKSARPSPISECRPVPILMPSGSRSMCRLWGSSWAELLGLVKNGQRSVLPLSCPRSVGGRGRLQGPGHSLHQAFKRGRALGVQDLCATWALESQKVGSAPSAGLEVQVC